MTSTRGQQIHGIETFRSNYLIEYLLQYVFFFLFSLDWKNHNEPMGAGCVSHCPSLQRFKNILCLEITLELGTSFQNSIRALTRA